MRILVVGGSGLVGANVAAVVRERGHQVTILARTPADGVQHALDTTTATVDELRAVLAGHDGVVAATRADEARPLRKPIRPVLHAEMVEPVERLFAAARAEGLTRGALMGSYYTYFARTRPEWHLPERHEYIRGRVEQAAGARAAAGPGLPVAVLELPFVFGRAGDRLPNWAPALGSWARSRSPLVAPRGGTAAVSARSVGLTTAEALEQADGADLALADENLTWAEMFARIAAAVGHPRTVRRLPASLLRSSLTLGGWSQAAIGKESGLFPGRLAGVLLAELFITPTTGRPLGTAVEETFA
ncbi:NAD-dependent epimerase/dehydratase family protein [Dactylosporangium matsuzakiense]|uniref:NAD(P)-binding domain-containing protein n=1 Tax=Dactylosporangium matsuzakiense TaxID=53360 RepID=A0A9W6KV47_9ACTN|nr:NAD(P)H-binding protein [Dactylosporangium matsuzakiense]GLL07770.1 hypothetical protein GCM10017581_095270 [Dactylosporangium matsuzakiense]